MTKNRKVIPWFVRICKSISFSWFIRNIHAEEVHTGILMLVYTILLLGGFFLFYSFNCVPTRSIEIQVEELKREKDELCQLISDTLYSCYVTNATIKVSIPMIMQSDSIKDYSVYIQYNDNYEQLDSNTNLLTYGYVINKFRSVIDRNHFKLDSLFHVYWIKNGMPANVYDPYYDGHLIDSLSDICNTKIPTDTMPRFMYYACVDSRTTEKHLNIYKLVTDEGVESVSPVEVIYGMTEGSVDHVKEQGFIKSNGSFPNWLLSSNTFVFSTPSWLSLSDISQCYFKAKLKTSSVNNCSFTIDFIGVTEFSNMDPAPDVVTMSSITFNDPYKIQAIKNRGLTFHGKFSEMENKQNVRNFALTSLMALVIGVIIKEFFILLYYVISKRKQQ